MVSILQAVILSVVQGITEWFPISSSGHLAIFQNIFGFQNLAYDVFLHFTSILAVIIIFRKQIIELFTLNKKQNWKYLGLLLIALIPAGLVGFYFNSQIESFFSNLYYLGLFFIFSGILIYLTKFTKEKKQKLSVFDSIFIGIFQALAILPGISRSGMTIGSGLYRGLKKSTAITFSFLLAIPLILAASIYETKNLIMSDINISILILSLIITFIVSYITIKLLLRIIKSDKFYLFGIYNIILGLIVYIWAFL